MKSPNRFKKTLVLAGVVSIVALAAISTTPVARAQHVGPQTTAPASPAAPPPYHFPCDGGPRYYGNLSFSGDLDYQPNGSYYYSSSSGLHKGCLVGPTTADFDLHLQKWNGSAWVIIASSENEHSTEFISTLGFPGFYRWQIYSYDGFGSYTFWRLAP